MVLGAALVTVVGVVGRGVEELVLGLALVVLGLVVVVLGLMPVVLGIVLVVLGMVVVVVKGRVDGIRVVFGVVMHVAALCTELRIVPIEL